MHDEGHINEKNRNYLLVDQPKAGRFYLFPKIHKAGTLGRPIIFASGHPTLKISEFVDLHLQPHVQNLPSYLKDTTDFLRKQDAQAPFPPDTFLVSMDVNSLYTNISHQDGIKACEEVWEEERIVKDPPTQRWVKLLTLILKCNNFEFNWKHYPKVQGTAMGTKTTSAYANIFMGRLERLLLRSVALRPFSWLRFIDDSEMKWSHGRETLTTFLDEANNFHPSIKLTAEISTKQHVFLNTKSSCGRYNICWSVNKTNRYTPVSSTHKLLLKTQLQKCSLQPCTSLLTHLLRFGHFWIKNKRPPLQTGLSETEKFHLSFEGILTLSNWFTYHLKKSLL